MTKFELKLLTDYGYVPYGKDEEGYTTYFQREKHLIFGIRRGWNDSASTYVFRLKGPLYHESVKCTGKVEPQKSVETIFTNATDEYINQFAKHFRMAAQEWETLKNCINSMEDPFADKDAILNGDEEK